MGDPEAGLSLSYVVPLRWRDDAGLAELAAYLRRIAEQAEVIVVDGSATPNYARHASALAPFARHMPPASRTPMGKVGGVLTGIRAASHEHVILADDDVRYDSRSLARVGGMLEDAELVRPQNHFEELPWHAVWDTGRTLINRAVGRDFPGTLGVRRSFVLSIGGYDGDVLFENLELIRTVEAAGGRVLSPLDLYVARRPPTTDHFFSQRVRQAYDDFALPARMSVFLAAGPLVTALAARRHGGAILALGAATATLAEIGRRRGGGAEVFPPAASLVAPGWALERALCAWLAVASRVRHGGVPYGDTVLRRSATSPRRLRARFAARRATLEPV